MDSFSSYRNISMDQVPFTCMLSRVYMATCALSSANASISFPYSPAEGWTVLPLIIENTLILLYTYFAEEEKTTKNKIASGNGDGSAFFLFFFSLFSWTRQKRKNREPALKAESCQREREREREPVWQVNNLKTIVTSITQKYGGSNKKARKEKKENFELVFFLERKNKKQITTQNFHSPIIIIIIIRPSNEIYSRYISIHSL
jgi:hypothetical protein